ncbi:MAG: DUF1934 domain-containing protein [Lachnospiraceae bacterium]|jgi:uncharacterized beta-barrel protein YwiB (DUF1934 family)
MSKEVLIKIRGVQNYSGINENPDAPIEVRSVGQYEYRDGSHILKYDEMMDDEGAIAHTRTVISDDGVSVSKDGAVNVTMAFEKGKTSVSSYETPFGIHELEIFTTSLETERSFDGIETNIRYVMSINGVHLADCFVNYQVSGIS